jgi:hypothetical protein
MESLFADPRITTAASQIASMVLGGPWPVYFKVSGLMERVIQKPKPVAPTEAEMELMDQDPDALAPHVVCERDRLIKTFARNTRDYRHLKEHFIAALTEALQAKSVRELCPCIISQVGAIREAHDEAYVVLREPEQSECYVLAL